MTSTSRLRLPAFAALGIGVLVAGASLAAPAQAAPSNTTAAEASCVRALPTGTSTLAVDFAGESFDVAVHVPEANAHKTLPLVLDLHGSNNNAELQAQTSGLRDVADEEGFIVAEPQGDIAFEQTMPGGNWAWNVPGVPLTSGENPPEGSRDDVAFLRAVVDQIDSAGCVDDDRVYATGFSGGGRMSSALACEASDMFAAIAPVGGLRAGRADLEDLTVPEAGGCDPENPVAVVTFHGTDDMVNPWNGNEDPRWGYSAETAAKTWAGINDCAAGSSSERVSESVTKSSWSKCDKQADVEVYEVAGGGHTWPGTSVPQDQYGLGHVTQEVDATQIMWDFFEAHPKRG